MNDPIMFSASDLVKKSVRQLKYLRDRSKPAPTNRMLKGVEHQKKIVEAKHTAAEEMRGIFSKDDILIFYSNDMIYNEELYEIKSIDPNRECPDWYLKSSLLQVAFYKAMLMQSTGLLSTPSFRVKEGYDKISINVDPLASYYLLFGDDKYTINVNNPAAITEFFIEKAHVSLLDWQSCEIYDSKYKFKEVEQLQEYYSYNLIGKYNLNKI